MIGKWVVLAVAMLMSLSAPAIRPALATEGSKVTSPISTISGFFSSRKLNMLMHPGDAAQAGKQTSVILKRQVPIRFGEAPRSWLGGLPMMPESIAWPRAANGAPLHFIAEIDCADLPANLWDGLGPRTGWLLLFVDVLEFEDLTADGAVQVLHVDRFGPERQPPDDMSTVRHSMSDFIGYEAEFRPGVPKMWRRWPVDLVVQEYALSDVESDGPPPVSGEELYKASVSKRGMGSYEPDGKRPLTWRGALYFVEGIIRDYERGSLAQRSLEGRLRDIDRQGAAKWDFAEQIRRRILAQNLDAPLSDADWQAIETTCRARIAEPGAPRIFIKPHLKMAVREDLIDAYVRAGGTGPAVPKALLPDVEARLRFILENRPHRMGGKPGRIQPDSGPVPDGPLLFQMGSDEAMGWSWGDAGALYVAVPPEDLQQGRFDHVQAWIEGY